MILPFSAVAFSRLTNVFLADRSRDAHPGHRFGHLPALRKKIEELRQNYDVIIVEGGVETLPETLCDQLKEGGRMAVIFMEGALGTVRVGHKYDGAINWRFAFNGTAPVLPGFTKDEVFAL